ncbi:hypothetical protein [Maribacter halichondriae]|uniref:hypothetical protein n=1 Tax=Maribacter halichondriae TaxID=2980554 RepID=UPI002358439B|nr:hypothetical protein [Maribacter sp. Hal144]
MEITLFTRECKPVDSIAHFMDFYYSLQLRYLASDLLNQGLTPKQINDAVIKAMGIGKSSGMDLRQHFRPVFSGIDKEIISDCKLSHFAYGLVLMNAVTELSFVGNFQVDVLQQ